jgi:hypothetical protein
MATDKFVLPTSASSTKLDLYLDRLAAQTPTTGRLIFAIDATASRQPTWDLAISLTAKMFEAVKGLPLSVQLVYYRGLSECQATGFLSDARTLTDKMRKVHCEGGETQINRILAHAQKENNKQKVAAMVFVGDCCEEDPDKLAATAGRLHVPVFLFQEGDDTEATAVFKTIAHLTKGAHCKFDKGSAKQLAELLGAVAAYATGGQQALMSTQAGVLLLKQLKS